MKKQDINLFGWPSQGKFVLYSSCVEGSLMRNTLSFQLSMDMGHYATRFKYVELFIAPTNSTHVHYPEHYHGVYIVMERIQQGKNFVNVKKMSAKDESEPAITGGYVFKTDQGKTDDPYLKTDYTRYIMMYPDDEALSYTKIIWLYEYIVKFEDAIMDANFTYQGQHYSELINVSSWIDNVIMQELTKNTDAYRLSSYFYKDRGGPVQSGPLWDMDRSMGEQFFSLYNTNGFIFEFYNSSDQAYKDLSEIPAYWGRLVSDPSFVAQMKARWADLRAGPFATNKVIQRISELKEILHHRGTTEREFNRWGPWYYPLEFWTVEKYWERQVRLMQEWLVDRLEWLDGGFARLG